MKILLVGNYGPDRQQSMQRFADVLRSGLVAAGHQAELLAPAAKFGGGRGGGLDKWFGYIDKFVLFPRELRRAARHADLVHICDHSNAPYVRVVRSHPHLVTCHDLLAVRGALGEETDCPASRTGEYLQRWILRSLKDARMVACVSSATRGDLLRLGGPGMAERSAVVLLGVAPQFAPLSPGVAADRLATLPRLAADQPFLLNVGSSLRRKNRDGVLRIFARVAAEWPGQLVFAGDRLPPELLRQVEVLGLRDRVVEIERPSDAVLEALYHRAFALLFPTRYEGFGWPAIEAQACGCPVLSSTSTSLPEVLGDSALLRDVGDEAGFAADILQLRDPGARQLLIEKGFANVKRFAPERMVADYLQLYGKLWRAS